MLPKEPVAAATRLGFLYVPPYRVQGVSIAGEQTCVQVPELDICFDIGLCPRIALTSPYVAISHGHMDHVAGLPYYFSQRMFQKIGMGKCVCHPTLATAIANMMESWAAVEQQRTPHEIIPLEPDQQIEIKNNIHLRAIEVSHTVNSMGYAVIEKRSKLKPEFSEMPQEKLRELKASGQDITYTMEIPLVAYTGDCEFGPYLLRDEFARSKIVIAECTFLEEEHTERAGIGKHLHVDDIARLLPAWEAEAVVLVHQSRRTNMAFSREQLIKRIGDEAAMRVHFLMDHRANKERYARQAAEAGIRLDQPRRARTQHSR